MYNFYPFQNGLIQPQLQIPTQSQAQAQTQSIQYVSGAQDVEPLYLPPNSSAVYLDSNGQKFYTKHTDANGTATIKSFDYKESEEDKPVEYVTKAEFEKFKANINKGVRHEQSTNEPRKQQNSNAGSRGNDEG